LHEARARNRKRRASSACAPGAGGEDHGVALRSRGSMRRSRFRGSMGKSRSRGSMRKSERKKQAPAAGSGRGLPAQGLRTVEADSVLLEDVRVRLTSGIDVVDNHYNG